MKKSPKRSIRPFGTFNTFPRSGASYFLGTVKTSFTQAHSGVSIVITTLQISSPRCWFIQSIERNRGPFSLQLFSASPSPNLFLRICYTHSIHIYTPTQQLLYITEWDTLFRFVTRMKGCGIGKLDRERKLLFSPAFGIHDEMFSCSLTPIEQIAI